jgi:hypothetical protein
MKSGSAHIGPNFRNKLKNGLRFDNFWHIKPACLPIGESVDRSTVADLDRLAAVLAWQKPAWEPGRRQGYHALTLGFYEGELLRRVDPKHRSLGQFFEDEIASWKW